MSDVTNYIAGALTATFAGIFSVWFKQHLDLNGEKLRNRKLIYQQLMGMRSTMQQLEASRAEAEVQSYYHEALLQRGLGDRATELQEAKEKQNLSIEFGQRLVLEKRRLYEVIANTALSFKGKEIQAAIDKLYGIGHIQINAYSGDQTPESLREIYVKSLAEVHKTAQTKWREPIDALLSLVKSQLN